VTIALANAVVDLHSEVVWQNSRGDVAAGRAVRRRPERDGDLLRRRVSDALRAERAHAAG